MSEVRQLRSKEKRERGRAELMNEWSVGEAEKKKASNWLIPSR